MSSQKEEIYFTSKLPTQLFTVHTLYIGSNDAEGGGDDKGMMDNLLGTLRNGGDNDASRRDRRRKNHVDHTLVNVAVKAQDLLTSLREDRQHNPLLHE